MMTLLRANATLIIMILALILRYIGIDWDQGFHLHPDERMLIMVADKVHFFSNLNPQFFNYGSLPIYLLKGITQLSDAVLFTHFSNYDGLLYVGRALSIAADIITLIFVYKIAVILFKNIKVATLSMLVYALAFFPIQNTHFFVVDVFLTTFVTILFYHLLKYVEETSVRRVFYIALFSGAILATKFTGIIFVGLTGAIIVLGNVILNHSISLRVNSVKDIAQMGVLAFARAPSSHRLRMTILYVSSTLLFHFIFMPYAYLSYEQFLRDISQQVAMNSNAYVFPYTLQYVGTLPYLYYLKNIFLWGLGPVISMLTILGSCFMLHASWLRIRHSGKRTAVSVPARIATQSAAGGSRISRDLGQARMTIIFFLFYLIYFLVVGRSAVKFMRYMLPLYPFFAILAGYALYRIGNFKFQVLNFKLVRNLILVFVGAWTMLFVGIYFQPHTRIAANEWIQSNIPFGSTIAVEHWDDRLPLTNSEYYKIIELTLYDQPDNEYKWEELDRKLRQTEYLIIASNRLYTPLQYLNNCEKYTACYPLTAEYYKNLFAGNSVTPDLIRGPVRFTKVAEFSSYPEFQISNFKFQIPDDAADESFTVYDHPKIMIFKRK